MRCVVIHPTPTIDRMPANAGAPGSREPPRFEILVRGPIGPAAMQAFPTFTASRRGHDTLLSGSIRDQSALYGVISQLEALGLQLLEIHPPEVWRHRNDERIT